jgi:hypoxanthine phosphoribosyltransferase
MRDTSTHNFVLSLANNLIAFHGTPSLLAFSGLVFSAFTLLTAITSTAAIAGSPTLLGQLLLLSVAIAISLSLLCRVLRWNLIAWGVRGHLKPIAFMQPQLLIGIGPGGAIIAAIIAKQLIDAVNYEPLVTIVDRVFKRDGAFLDVQVTDITKLQLEVGDTGKPVLLVTSEVHSGNTLKKVGTQLTSAGIKHQVFAFVASPHSCYRVDHCVLASETRGILPWRDAPARDDSSE